MCAGRARERSRDAPTRRSLHDRPRRAGARPRGGRVPEGPGAPAHRRAERLLDAQIHPAAPGAGADARRLLPRVSAFRDLRELVARLEQTGRLRRVSVPVSRDLEITEITDRVSKGPADRNLALLFERVEGFDMPVLVNTFGAADRLAMALGVGHLDELGERVG